MRVFIRQHKAPKGGFTFIIPASVFAVAEKGHFPPGKLHANLVRSPCDKLYKHQRARLSAVLKSFEHAVFKHGFFNSAPLALYNKNLVFLRIFKEQILKAAFCFFRNTAYYRKVFLFKTRPFLNQP